MSAISSLSRSVGPDGIRRYRTRIRLWVHSHNHDNVIDLSEYVTQISTNKMIKNLGQFSFTVVGANNWLNTINPNDLVNLYIDRGDQEGWVRTFFGFIDNIKFTYSSSENGVPITGYTVSCSDFQKAFEKTQIYFNPHVAARNDFQGNFVGTPNIAGMALMNRGITINASPPDLVTNVVLLLLGFGSQFTLPSSYNPQRISRIRQERANVLLGQLDTDVRNTILNAGGYQAFLERIRTENGIQTPVDQLTDPELTTSSAMQIADRARFSSEVISALGGTGSGIGVQGLSIGTDRGVVAYNALNTTLSGYPPTLLDIIDISTFVERKAMDGYFTGAAVWERQGNILSFLRSVANEIVNELFFDLRLISLDGGLTEGEIFSTDVDDIQGNVSDNLTRQGKMYIPALVMREYPFSTINRISGENFPLTINGSTDQENLGNLYFGAIFSDQPNRPGRHVINIPNINPQDIVSGRTAGIASKHLDVAVIKQDEIQSMSLSRSDSEHFNLMEVLATDAINGEYARYYTQDLLPIITPIHIVRHGLRVRSLQTRATTFPPTLITRRITTGEEEAEEEVVEPELPAMSTSRLPIDFIPGIQGFVSSRYGYRNRLYPSTASGPLRPFNGLRIIPPGERIWRFHNGVDFAATTGTPVYAVRDGWVVCASPARNVTADGNGEPTPGFGGYGGTVIIYHDQDSPESADGTAAEGAVFTLYAHLSQIESRFIQGSSEAARHRMAPEIRADGTYIKQRVRAGDKIGEVGRTGFVDRNMGAHLHFEVLIKKNNRVYPSMLRHITPDILQNSSQLASNGGWAPNTTPQGGTTRISTAIPELPDSSQMISQDPLPILERWTGSPVPVGRLAIADDPGISTVSVEEDSPYDGDADELIDELPEQPPSASEEAEDTLDEVEETQSIGYVDTPEIRRQLARWALLNDHWYQHNLEYLAGTIVMRGAPEIRVGYRLDISDMDLSFYVEGVSHAWTYGRDMTTTLHVTRGQPNNPYPGYVLPNVAGFNPTDTQRRTGSRLAKFFIVPDPLAVRRALSVRGRQTNIANPTSRHSPDLNETDSSQGRSSLSDLYNERILEAESITVDVVMNQRLEEAAHRIPDSSTVSNSNEVPSLGQTDLVGISSGIA